MRCDCACVERTYATHVHKYTHSRISIPKCHALLLWNLWNNYCPYEVGLYSLHNYVYCTYDQTIYLCVYIYCVYEIMYTALWPHPPSWFVFHATKDSTSNLLRQKVDFLCRWLDRQWLDMLDANGWGTAIWLQCMITMIGFLLMELRYPNIRDKENTSRTN